MLKALLARDGQRDRARDKRRSYPIHVYVGHNGSGKSLTAVWDTMPTLAAGRPVLSTVRLLDYANLRPCEGIESTVVEWHQDDDRTWRPLIGIVPCTDLYHGLENHLQAHPLYVPFTSWRQLLDWKFGDILMDEVTGVADSTDWASVPAAIVNKFPQLRRHECALRITSLSYSNANKRIRQAAMAVTRCHGTLPASARSAFGTGRVYRPRRLVNQVTFDAQTLPMDDPSLGAWDRARVLSKGRLWVPDCEARNAYDTYAPVMTVGTVTDTGRCAVCGGTRRAAECSCADYHRADAAKRRGTARSAPVREDGPHAHAQHELLEQVADRRG